MLSQGYMGAPLYHSTGQVGPRFGTSGLLMEWNGCYYYYVMVEAAILPYSNCFPHPYKIYTKHMSHWNAVAKCIYVHPYNIPPSKLAPDLGILGCLLSGDETIISWLRLPSYSNYIPHPY